MRRMLSGLREYANLGEWLAEMVLVGARLGGLFVFAPIFSSAAISAHTKMALTISLTVSLGPLILSMPGVNHELSLWTLLAECVISALFGLTLSLIMELGNLVGQVVGMQTSLTLVNLLDPNSGVETTLFSQMLQLFVVTVLITSGMDRVVLQSLLKTFEVLPPGSLVSKADSVKDVLSAVSGIFLSALQMAAPLLAGTVLVEISIALMAKLSPSLPVMTLTVPAKTLIGMLIVSTCLTSWSRLLQLHFTKLLHLTQLALHHSGNSYSIQ